MNPNFIFIGGIPRSGTSLIQKIVGLNEDVYAGPEFDHLPSIVKLYFQMLGNERQAEFYTDNGLTNSFRKFIESVLAEKLFEKQIKVKYISEKTPENILAFKGLEKIFPNAKFLIIIRDPRAVINSFQNVSLRAKRSGTSVKFGKNIIKDLSFMRYRIDLAEQISNENPDKCFILHYEDLLKDPESVISSICTFLDLKYTKNMLKTETKTNISNLMERFQGKDPWYNNEIYDRHIDLRSLNSWTNQLDWKTKKLTAWFFLKFKNRLLVQYDFNLSTMDKVRLLPAICLEVIKNPRYLKKIIAHVT